MAAGWCIITDDYVVSRARDVNRCAALASARPRPSLCCAACPSPVYTCPRGARLRTVHAVGSAAPCITSDHRAAARTCCPLPMSGRAAGGSHKWGLCRLRFFRIIFVPHCPGSSAGQIFPKNWPCAPAVAEGCRGVCLRVLVRRVAPRRPLPPLPPRASWLCANAWAARGRLRASHLVCPCEPVRP